ncbi:MAG: hypothetical protein AB7N91_11835 [Candidatus Tectimicrobiota bacterium]
MYIRRAGLAWGKGDLPAAIAAIQEGIALATDQGDTAMAHVLQQDLLRYQRALEGAPVDLTQD